jgi:hypothetical protein
MNDAPSSLRVQIKLAAKYVVQPPSGESVSSIPTLSSKTTSIQDSPVALINPLLKRRAKSIEKPYLSGP